MQKRLILLVLMMIIIGTAYAERAPLNVALNKPVFTSGDFSTSFPKTALVDGNHATVWGSKMNAGDQWFFVDLGTPTAIADVLIKFYNPYYSPHYYVGISDDAATWTFAATITNGNGGDDLIPVNMTARYIGVLLTKGAQNVYGINEFEVYQKVPPTPTPTATTTPNPNLPDISFQQPWSIPAEGTLSGDVLTLTGDPNKYIKAQLTIPKPIEGNLYIMADVRFSGLVPGAANYKRPKIKIYDGMGTKIALQNFGNDIEDMWIRTGVILAKKDSAGTTTLTIEFGLQNCGGTFEIRSPYLLDIKPAPAYDFPFEVPADPTCRLDVKTTEFLPINNDILSVNSHFSWMPVGYENERIKDIYRRVALPNVRFPGGTVGNYYDWQTDTFYPELITDRPSLVKAYESGFHFQFDTYAALMNELNARPTLLFNVIADSVDKSKLRLADRIQSGIDVTWIEMGNENYFPDQQGGYVTDVNSYITHTRNLTTGLKEVDPSVKTTINIGKDFFGPGDWNEILSAETYYDGVTMHPYVRPMSFFLNQLAAYRMLSAFGIVTNYLDKYTTMFGTKPVLLTEWGILPDGSGNNFVQALGTADAFFAILDGALEGYVEQAGIHIMFAKDADHDTALYIYDEATAHISRTRLGVIYEKYVELFRSSDVFTARSSAAELIPGVPAVNARALITAQGKPVIVAVNKLPTAAPLEISMNGKAYTGAYELNYFTEDPLGDDKLYELTDNPWITATGNGVVSLPAYSICYIVL